MKNTESLLKKLMGRQGKIIEEDRVEVIVWFSEMLAAAKDYSQKCRVVVGISNLFVLSEVILVILVFIFAIIQS